ncbi:hypothetical protein IFM89_008845 [Coptis chinensis]|uniref:Uncharacterized protein n=1 Tax=Coptis chinensis TaxID=261450 RepID=A0A835LLX0_9MAGN|nr:hypothetical protein IFM89_008845 [Coptis chinensis]
MRKFDPWPVFFKREWKRTWPFLVGFAVTGAVITKMTLNLTEEDKKNSPFVQRHKRPSKIGILDSVNSPVNGFKFSEYDASDS